jgi:glycine/D-amino acid oxidase-like deaminating enzyme
VSTTRPDVIVVGGGIHGCSTALHCSIRGLKVLLLEKDYAGRHSSGVNAGGVRQLARDVAEIPLSVYSMELWHRIVELVDDDCGFTSDGQVLVAETQDEFESFRARVQELNGLGYRHEELIDAAELRRLVPAVAETCPGGIVSRRDGAADPFRTTQAFRRKAEKLGARVLEGVMVTDVAREGSTWIVRTSAGLFETPVIVNAAGAWADRIAAMLGEPVPLEVIAPMLMITARVPAFIRPVVILRGRKLSFKQFANGTVLIGGGHLGRPVRDQNVTVLDWTKLAESAKTVWDVFPAMRATTILRAWAGIEARMPDDIPVFGKSSTSEGAFHQFGFSAHGFQLGPGAGAVMAELIATGTTNMPIEAFRIERFRRKGAWSAAEASRPARQVLEG